jgi:hypothetical protein
MADYLLVPPTVLENSWSPSRLFMRYQIPRGITLVRREDNSIYESRYPALTELEEAAEYWLGGHEYVIDQATRDLLVAAGYGEYITGFNPPGSFGSDPFGSGFFGGYA